MIWKYCLALLPFGIQAAGPDFEKDVAPILEARCLSCHDEASAKGDVRLDTRAHFIDSIHVGKPDVSLLIEQVSGPEPEMPKKATPLQPHEVEILRQWIAAGAAWPDRRILKDNPPRNLDWWSLRPIRDHESSMPPGANANPVDFFVRHKLSEKGLTPVAEADPATLIRRLTYDLTGLPPTPEEVRTFVQEQSENSSFEIRNLSFNALVDRLLASPAFGEKWARHWLDAARYGETQGYDKDKPRMNAWPYRDYVIRSFNEDKPYPQFVQEQIAGDALYPGSADGTLGLGFLAAGPWDYISHVEVGEGKVDGRIAKHLDRDEMISAVFNVFTSTTVQCAQCHHHKFDPVRMEDYYRLHAVFAAVDRAERAYTGLSPEQEKQRNLLQAQINRLKAEQSRLQTEAKRALGARTSAIERRLGELRQKHGSPLRPQYGYHSGIAKRQDEIKWVQLDLGTPKVIEQLRVIPAFDRYNDIGAGFGFPVRYKVEVSNDADFKKDVRLVRDATAADQVNPRNTELLLDLGGNAARYIRLTATRLAPRKNDFILALGELEVIGLENQENLALGAKVTALDSIEAAPRWSRTNLTDGIFHRELDDPAALAELLDLEAHKTAIENELRDPARDARLKEIESQLAKLNPKLATFPKGELVFAAATDFNAQGNFKPTAGKARDIHLLNRGDIRAPGDLMQPGMPSLWPGAKEEFATGAASTESAARAALAESMTSRDNPLLWRSIVNRLWLWTFGQPLVGTPNDFGRMGMEPTHPELLDHLAARLRDDPRHSLKSIIRLLVTSQAYRRASGHDEANARLDAGNTLLWRANRRRLSAEEYRDSILAISGALRLEPRGGPSFQDFIIEKPQHSPHYQYHLHDPADPASHRRSIYRFIVRSQPQPFLTTLDCADPSQSVASRDESTTALQALAQWNNRLVESQARQFAQRLQPNQNIVHEACLLALGRPPTQEEKAVLTAHLQAHGPASLARVIFNLNAFVYLD
ncbi:DUF1549 domain-containing protein [Prosthecobacter sp. SYSU 5D2]|uniref:DUF1549 domain-containing protein n=1 Tax=Prosthecobacter sp. SYSU 5D2 TaxID=3134134 RepID=UPI0031FEA708